MGREEEGGRCLEVRREDGAGAGAGVGSSRTCTFCVVSDGNETGV